MSNQTTVNVSWFFPLVSKEQASMDWWTLRLKKIYMNLKLFWAIVLMFLLNVKNNKHD